MSLFRHKISSHQAAFSLAAFFLFGALVVLGAQAGPDLEPDEQPEVIAVVLDPADLVASRRWHRSATS